MINLKIQKEVLKLTKKIPKGKVSSYKEIAKKLKIHPRAVAKALAKNPHPVKIPCHRVVHSDGRIGGYKLGKKRKIELLKKEDVKINKDRIDKKYFYYFLISMALSQAFLPQESAVKKAELYMPAI